MFELALLAIPQIFTGEDIGIAGPLSTESASLLANTVAAIVEHKQKYQPDPEDFGDN
jgi:hypothetical protein